MKNVGDVQFVREQLEFRVDALLRKRGWKSTSSTPGCLWLWEKALPDGRVLLVGKETALHLERVWLAESCICTEDDGDEHRKDCPARGVP